MDRLPTLDELSEAGGLDSLFIESKDNSSSPDSKGSGKSLTIATVNGKQKPVDGRLFSATWNEENALVLMVDTRCRQRKSRRLHRSPMPPGKSRAQGDPRYRH